MKAIAPQNEKLNSFRWGIPKLITTKNGTVYRALIIMEKKGSLICDAYVAISLPLSDIISVWQKKPNVVATIIVYALPVAVVAGIITLGIILLNDPMALNLGGVEQRSTEDILNRLCLRHDFFLISLLPPLNIFDKGLIFISSSRLQRLLPRAPLRFR